MKELVITQAMMGNQGSNGTQVQEPNPGDGSGNETPIEVTAPPVVTPVTTEPAAKPEDNKPPALDFTPIFGALTDEFGEPVNSIDDAKKHIQSYKGKLKELEERDPLGHLPEFVKKAVDFSLNSDDPVKSLQEWVEIQGTDYDVLSKKDPESLIMMGLRKEYDYLTEEEILAKFEEKYAPLDKDDFISDELYNRAVNRRSADIKIDAQRYAKTFNELKAERSIPDATKREQKRIEDEKAQQLKYNQDMQAAFQSLHGKGLTIDGANYQIRIVGDDGKLTPEATGAVNAVSNPIGWMHEAFFTNGTIDPEKVFTVKYIMDNYENIAKIVGDAKKSKGVKDILKGTENPSTGKATTKTEVKGIDFSQWRGYFAPR